MPGTHPRELPTFEDSEEFYVSLGKGARDMLCLRTRLRDDAVTDESPEINLLCLENASVECCNRWRRTCRRRSFISEKSGGFHKSLLSVIAIVLCYVCVNTQRWRIFRGASHLHNSRTKPLILGRFTCTKGQTFVEDIIRAIVARLAIFLGSKRRLK